MSTKPERNMMRWRQVGDKFVVTNDAGEFVVLTPAEMGSGGFQQGEAGKRT